MKLEKILIVNDDIEDIAAMKARLPGDIVVVGASQFEAKNMTEAIDADLVVIDNDANNLQDSKGQLTLPVIKHLTDVPIIYTSFQPGWVPGSVYQTRGVQVIRTDLALDEIAKMCGIPLKEQQPVDSKEPTVSLILTYNPVTGYKRGVYAGGKLIVVSNQSYAQGRAKQVLAEQVAQVYKDFDWRQDRDLIRSIFVYDGINGGEVPGQVAQSLGHDVRMTVHLMACSCQWDRKQRLADSSYVALHQVECGGRDTLGKIGDIILGIKRPGVSYANLPMTEEEIKAPIHRWGQPVYSG